MITSMLFFPEKVFLESPSDYGLSAQDVFPVTTDGVQLHGWYIPANEPKAALLFMHGNAGNISGRLHKAAGWVKRGVSVLLLDYRGYGQSQGAIQHGVDIVNDAQAGLNWLTGEKKWALGHIILYGESLGSYPVTRLAVDHTFAGLILEAPFTAFTDLASLHYPALPQFLVNGLLKEFRFDNLGFISKVQPPVFIIHGTADATCPFIMGQKLFQNAPEPKYFLKVLNAGHNNLLETAGETYWDAPHAFLSKKTL
jgi:fermentation-respiration switch protein FrsA (DUF1100 family)